MNPPRTWLITGTSSGFGLELAKVVARKGDRVIATSRSWRPDSSSSSSSLDNIGPGEIVRAQLDHNEPLTAVQAAVAAVITRYGVPDVVFNNAAYLQRGFLEATSPEDTLRQYQANVFGPLNVYRALLPYLRERARDTGTGTTTGPILVTNGSMGAWFQTSSANLYTSSKAAVRNLMLGLADEVRPFGIRHLLVEPGFFRTALLDPSAGSGVQQQVTGEQAAGAPTAAAAAASAEEENPTSSTSAASSSYREQEQAADTAFRSWNGTQPGDPVRGCELLYEIITSSGRTEGRPLPAWLPLGSDACAVTRGVLQAALKTVDEWEALVSQTDFPEEER